MITAVQQNGYSSTVGSKCKKNNKNLAVAQTLENTVDRVSFKGSKNLTTKYIKMPIYKLAESMKDVTEYTNAIIAAIGTGIIAPITIMCSPGKGDKEDKDKKFFQAIRQPLSAGLALSFTVPATYVINNSLDKLGYEKQLKIFNDNILGTLVPSKSYLSKHISKDEISNLETKFEESIDGKPSLKQELEDEIREFYKDRFKIENISDEELAKEVNNSKTKFLKKKLVDEKYNKKLQEKFEELKDKNIEIEDSDLVTDKLKRRVENLCKDDLSKMEKDANLTWWDKTYRILGGSTKRVRELDEKIENFKTEKSIEFLREQELELFTDSSKKLKRFLDMKAGRANKLFGNKKYWMSLFVNLFMVAASCYALNWSHPRLKALIDKIKGNDNQQSDKKVEVRA